jgi:5-methylcytosine-specific restriction endonuclease McrA
MRREEDERLRQVYQYRCGYCGVSEQDCGAKLTIDHFQPRSRNGAHEPANWVYCCHACNEFKSDSWSPDSPHRILHPLREDVTAHIVEQDDGTLRGCDPDRYVSHRNAESESPATDRLSIGTTPP